MLLASFVLAVLIIEHFRKQTGKEIKWVYLLLYYSAVLATNIGCNLIRIIILSRFKIMPDNYLHEIIGIVCFIVYSIVPVYFMAKFLYKKTAVEQPETASKQTSSYLLWSVIFAGCIVMPAIDKTPYRFNNDFHYIIKNPKGSKTEILNFDVKKISMENLLIYEKPLHNFFSHDHNPLFCWTGSGYSIKQFEEININNYNIYIGQMQKDTHILYTAWYYSNGKYHTNSQWKWRLNALIHNDNFSLINISSHSKADIVGWLGKMES
jgi:exosortase N